MRQLLPLIAVLALLSAPAGAVKLPTHALVTLVEPAEAALDHWDEGAAPAWTVTGAPDEAVQLRLELRTADGRRIALDRPERRDLDEAGRLVAAPALPPVAPHEAVDVVTLVICRE